MVATNPFEQGQVVGEGKTQLICETFFNVEPPMSKIIGESYEVQITDSTVFYDRVLVKGIVEKTFYYKHPHLGKKGVIPKKDDSSKKEENKKNKETKQKDGFEDWWDLQSSESKTYKQTFGEDSKKDSASTDETQKTAEFKSQNGWGRRAESFDGIVHFYQQNLEFAGTIEIPGVKPGDLCNIELAEVRDYDSFIATNKENSGLINAGKQMFIIDIALKVARIEGKEPPKRQEFTKLL